MSAAIYRCINSECGRGFPRQVKFCPFCGTGQLAGGATPPRPADQAAPSGRAGVNAAAAAAAARARAAADASPLPAAAAPGEGMTGAARPPTVTAAVAAYADEALQDDRSGDAPAMTPEQIAAAQARLNKARGVPPAPASAPAPEKPAGQAGTPAGKPPPSARPAPGGNGPQGKPPGREPIGLATWVLVAMILAVIWYMAKPENRQEQLASRVEQAVKLTADCKLDEARAELAVLRTEKASAAQLKRVQDGIGSAVLGCEKKRQRAKAWTELRPSLENSLQAGALDTADSRLAAFTRKWGADDATREMDKRIDVSKAERLLDAADACLKKSDRACLESKLQAAEKLQRPELENRIRGLRESLSRLLEATVLEQKSPPALSNEPPRGEQGRSEAQRLENQRIETQRAEAQRIEAQRAAVRTSPPVISTAPQVQQAAQQARKILGDAERELNQGNYKGAMDKAEICATMIDVGNRDCTALKQRAERLNRDMLRCVASGADWINDRCQ